MTISCGKTMKCAIVFPLLICALFSAIPGSNGNQPGAEWTRDQIDIIRAKLVHLWDNPARYINFFIDTRIWHFVDEKTKKLKETTQPQATPEYTKYLYDPTRKLSTPDCKNQYESLCKTYWGMNRLGQMRFTEAKMIRLAFHDCIPNKDGTGGCDGCINFDDNLQHNNVLQPSVAMLEKMFLEKDFPKANEVPELSDSPKNLGMSRADLWHFAGLVALDRAQERTHSLCSTQKQNLTCNDWDSPCFSSFPLYLTRSLFKTGRTDCIPHPAALPEHGFRSTGFENEPDKNGNGKQTTNWFHETFNMNGREGLALMGAHTFGKFTTFSEHVDYAWVRDLNSNRNEIWNNEYYKVLISSPAHTKDPYCVGKMDGSAPEHRWLVRALLFDYMWPQPQPNWPDKPRRLLWNHIVMRSPVCEEVEEDAGVSMGEFWNSVDCDKKPKCKNSGMQFKPENKAAFYKPNGSKFWQYCCKQKKDECWKTDTCDPDCTRGVQDRIRHLSSDVGFYLKWDYDKEGYPTGCGVFDAFVDSKAPGVPLKFNGDFVPRVGYGWKVFDRRAEKYDNGTKSWFAEPGRIADCPKQDMDDGTGKPLHERVEIYASNQDAWMKDFIKAFAKMSENGVKSKLIHRKRYKHFWTQLKIQPI